MSIIQFVSGHMSVVLAALLTISEAMALLFPNATGIVKAISLLKGAGIKDANGQ